MSTGMTWEQVREQFDIPRVSAIQRYWSEYPPTNQLVAAYFGFTGKKKSGDLAELIGSLPEVRR